MKTQLAAFAAILAASFGATAQEEQGERSAELQVLDHFVGTWDLKLTTKTPDGEATSEGVSHRRWSVGGKYVLFDDPGSDGNELHMPLTYDSESGTYPGVMIIGKTRGVVTGTWDDETKTMSYLIDYQDKSTYRGTHRFLRDDYAEASGKITSASGEVIMEFVWKQTKRSAKSLPPEPTVDELIANYLKAIGGLEANKKHSTRRSEGTLLFPGVPEPFKMVATQKAPNLTHVKLDIPGLGEHLEGFDGKVAWRSNPNDGLAQLAGEELEMKKRDANFYQYIDLKSQFKTLSYEGRENANGVSHDVLKGTTRDGREENFYFDARTHLLRVVKRPETTLEFSDYRTVDGIESPFAIVIRVGGLEEMTLNMKIEKLTHGIEADDAIFAMPKQ